MLEDIKRTFGEVFGWVKTIYPLGKKTALIIFALALVAFAVYYFTCSILSLIVAIVYSIIALFTAFFFRDPYRPTVFKEDEIACPADGKILSTKTAAAAGTGSPVKYCLEDLPAWAMALNLARLKIGRASCRERV